MKQCINVGMTIPKGKPAKYPAILVGFYFILFFIEMFVQSECQANFQKACSVI